MKKQMKVHGMFTIVLHMDQFKQNAIGLKTCVIIT